MRIIYSFNKRGPEAEFWEREIREASTGDVRFIPFNHGDFVDTRRYTRAQLLDNLYFANDLRLTDLYASITAAIEIEKADVLLVDNQQPYHPEFLRNLNIYRVMRTSDGPLAAYERDIPYLHAFHHVLYHTPAYSRELGMREKLAYCGALNTDLWPLGVFKAAYESEADEDELIDGPRDIDILFIGALHPNKMPLLAQIKKTFRGKCRLYGLSSIKKNAYFNLKFGFPGWVRPIGQDQYVPLYRRAKLGINVHNRGKFTVGGYRLFELPANGVMQISDGGEYLDAFFSVGTEIVGYRDIVELTALIRYYLDHDAERRLIARAGRHRVLRDHTMQRRFSQLPGLLRTGMSRLGYSPPPA
jgi:hypothetical protein